MSGRRSVYNQRLLEMWADFEKETGVDENSIPSFTEWAIQSGRWRPGPMDIHKRLAEDMANALGHARKTDEYGIKYRARLCVKTMINGDQLNLWADADKCTQRFAEKSFSQRRSGVVRDVYQWKLDVDHFNMTRKPERPIQLHLDFTDDIAELEAMEREKRKKKSA